jgi:DNA polymerase/3'-5' exonuclease PolX
VSAATERLPYADAYKVADRLVGDYLAMHCVHAEIAGSIRRRAPTVGDIEVVAVPMVELRYEHDLFGAISRAVVVDFLAERLDRLAEQGVVTRRARPDGKLVWGPSWKSFDFEGARIDLYTPEQGRFGWILALRTGPAAFSRQLVVERGQTTRDGRPGLLPPTIRPRDGWLTRPLSGERIETPTEREVFALFEMPYLAPADRR